jgi:hypothetical protein
LCFYRFQAYLADFTGQDCFWTDVYDCRNLADNIMTVFQPPSSSSSSSSEPTVPPGPAVAESSSTSNPPTTDEKPHPERVHDRYPSDSVRREAQGLLLRALEDTVAKGFTGAGRVSPARRAVVLAANTCHLASVRFFLGSVLMRTFCPWNLFVFFLVFFFFFFRNPAAKLNFFFFFFF